MTPDQLIEAAERLKARTRNGPGKKPLTENTKRRLIEGGYEERAGGWWVPRI